LVLLIEFRVGNGFVYLLAQIIADERQCSTSVSNRSVWTTVNDLAIDGGRRGGKLPKAFGGVDADIVRFFDAAAVEDLLIDVAECIE
jgi:hypothetical protein